MTTGPSTELRKTPLFDWHSSHGGKMADFAGWSMPIQYSSIVEEHLHTRSSASMFDVSHMARLEFRGAGANSFLNRLLTRRVDNMKVGQVRYSLILNQQAGVLDDVLVYRTAIDARHSCYWMVVNAGNHQKISSWIGSQPGGEDFEWIDHTAETAMMAIQGPRAVDLVKAQLQAPLDELKYYHSTRVAWDDHMVLASRTGYTGEDGCELILPADCAVEFWMQLIAAGNGQVKAAGLGARDTLRVEAGMPLYGHELSETMNPCQAGLGFAVNMKNRDFIGRTALEAIKAGAIGQQRIGLLLDGRRVPRTDYPIIAGGEPVGLVTSGTFSPTLERPIAMGYVQPEWVAVDTRLEVDIRGRLEKAKVVKLPFYTRDG